MSSLILLSQLTGFERDISMLVWSISITMLTVHADSMAIHSLIMPV